MVCVDFPAGANPENGNHPEILPQSITIVRQFSARPGKADFLWGGRHGPFIQRDQPEEAPSRTPPDEDKQLRQHVLKKTIRDVKSVPPRESRGEPQETAKSGSARMPRLT
jgi:hypothetical protein